MIILDKGEGMWRYTGRLQHIRMTVPYGVIYVDQMNWEHGTVTSSKGSGRGKKEIRSL